MGGASESSTRFSSLAGELAGYARAAGFGAALGAAACMGESRGGGRTRYRGGGPRRRRLPVAVGVWSSRGTSAPTNSSAPLNSAPCPWADYRFGAIDPVGLGPQRWSRRGQDLKRQSPAPTVDEHDDSPWALPPAQSANRRAAARFKMKSSTNQLSIFNRYSSEWPD